MDVLERLGELPQQVSKFTEALMRIGEQNIEPGASTVEADIDMGDGVARATVSVSQATFSLNVSFNGEYLVLDMVQTDGHWLVEGPIIISGVEYSDNDLWRLLEELEQLTNEME